MSKKNDEFEFPDRIYVDCCLNLSPKKGSTKFLTYVLKKTTEEEHYVEEIATFYRMSGLDLKADMRKYMDLYDEVLVSYWPARGVPTLANNYQETNWYRTAAYKIIGRHVLNPNRVYINKKTKATLKMREKMADSIPMLNKVTTNSISVNRKLLLEYINEELKKKGYKELSQYTTIQVD